MTAETTSVLRPMRLVELLDAAFRLYRRNFWTFVGIIALVQIPVSSFSLAPSMLMLQGIDATDMSQLSIEYFLGLGLTFVLGLVQFILISGVATLALTRAIIAAYLGRKNRCFGIVPKNLAVIGAFPGCAGAHWTDDSRSLHLDAHSMRWLVVRAGNFANACDGNHPPRRTDRPPGES